MGRCPAATQALAVNQLLKKVTQQHESAGSHPVRAVLQGMNTVHLDCKGNKVELITGQSPSTYIAVPPAP